MNGRLRSCRTCFAGLVGGSGGEEEEVVVEEEEEEEDLWVQGGGWWRWGWSSEGKRTVLGADRVRGAGEARVSVGDGMRVVEVVELLVRQGPSPDDPDPGTQT